MRFLEKDIHDPYKLFIEHKGEKLDFVIKTFRSFNINERTIGPINLYWSMLPEEDQQIIFETYRAIYNDLYTIGRLEQMKESVNQHMRVLMEYHTFEKMQRFVNLHLHIKHPEEIRDTIPEDAHNYTKDMTYLRQDHVQLVILALMLKPVLPVWGTFISVVSGNKEKTNFEEHYCVLLLRGTDVVNCPPYKRLCRYIEATCKYEQNKPSTSALIGGLPESDIPRWLLYNVLVRKVAGLELYQLHDEKVADNYIVNIYNHAFKLSDSLDKQFGGMINDKPAVGSGNHEEDNTSVAENYKIKQEIAEGNIATHEVYLIQHAEQILQKIDSSCPVEPFHQIKQQFDERFKEDFEFHLLGLSLTKWVLDPVVLAESLDNINYHAVTNAYHITHTLLNHWGFPTLAMLLYAQPREKSHVSFTSKVSITEEQLAQLDIYYPHRFNKPGKQKISRMDSNMAVVGIKTVLEPFYGRWWELNPWDDRRFYNKIIEDFVPLPHDAEYLLAELILKIRRLQEQAIQ